ncbi:hypothetical protein AMATHDRAFT_4309 [Amanita thiersii Skay4041]|uniref:Uncharacterized protein n=1 Tax=Amanita thiersii Skay4041 TaxID=703135 RepID=A0A2A9NQU7_9AGAR|nr:hypothetical protein AMATHDRAFT_4309 [Amanita thiersii Skay4041]
MDFFLDDEHNLDALSLTSFDHWSPNPSSSATPTTTPYRQVFANCSNQQQSTPCDAHLLDPWNLPFNLSPSPSDTSCSSITSSPQQQSIHVICNAPLVAPIPLPYHSPTFLQFDLPDIDQDLSHPPYTSRSPKRKRDADATEPADDIGPHKRPALFLPSSRRQPCRRQHTNILSRYPKLALTHVQR